MFRLFLFCFFLLFASTLAQVPLSCNNPVDPLETKDIPAIDTALSGFKSANVLTLVFTSKLVNNRSDATILVNQTTASSVCNYNGADTTYWSRTQDNAECTETWTLTMPWSVARYQCGFVRTEDSNSIYFDTDIEVTQVETLEKIRETELTRDLITGIAAQVIFPKTIDLESAQVQVFAPVNVIAAITRQEFEPDQTLGQIDMFTSVQWPFKLKNFFVNSTDNNATLSVFGTVDNCPSDSPCEQTTTLNYLPNSCTLSGNYNLYFEFECHENFTGACPLQGEDGVIAYVLESGDLCAIFKENVDLTGTLTSFLQDYTTARDAFLQDQTSYWIASVDSTKVSIIDSNILQAYSNHNGAGSDTKLFDVDEGGATAEGVAAGYTLDGNGGNVKHSRFFLTMTSALFPVPEDQFEPAIIKVRVSVTYQNTAKRNVRRYGDLKLRLAYPDTKNGDLDTEATIGMEGAGASSGGTGGDPEEKPTAGDGDGGNETPMWPIAVLVSMLCCGMFALFAGVVYYRRRKQQQENAKDSRASSVSESTEPSTSTHQV